MNKKSFKYARVKGTRERWTELKKGTIVCRQGVLCDDAGSPFWICCRVGEEEHCLFWDDLEPLKDTPEVREAYMLQQL